ncbi:hypothetical protein HMPREF0973_01717 [Prevotella veroralis F0319]|uniref:Uncharacterized protein n=1 Tax=Prevotella veroralis F0319 TaxID=649761 RepID=C9MQ19_9BACT|nr:hypothetical protein HMPREF0973_01717 [Prevotella veroralis F0319]
MPLVRGRGTGTCTIIGLSSFSYSTILIIYAKIVILFKSDK